MMRKWTLVSVFAALAVISWAQPPAAPPGTDASPTPVQEPGQRRARPNQQPDGSETTEKQRRARNRNAAAEEAAGPQRSTDALVRPNETRAVPADATPFVPSSTPEARPDATPRATPDASPGLRPDTTPRITPDVSPDAPGTAPDSRPGRGQRNQGTPAERQNRQNRRPGALETPTPASDAAGATPRSVAGPRCRRSRTG